MLPVMRDIEGIVLSSKDVFIREQGIDAFCRAFDTRRLHHWLSVSPYDITKLGKEERLHYLFVLDAISFCYWGNPKWRVLYKGEWYDGTKGMMAALGRAIEEGTPILDPVYLTRITRGDLEAVLRGNTKIPLLDERVAILRELGRITTERFDKRFSKVLEKSDGTTGQLVRVLIETYPSFFDAIIYNGTWVYFSKRAQLLVADIYHVLRSEEQNTINGIEDLTACADYKLPQVLRHEGVIEYSTTLAQIIDRQIELPKDHRLVTEIRAATIYAVRQITQRLSEQIPTITDNQVNDYVWLLGQNKARYNAPYLLTRTTAF